MSESSCNADAGESKHFITELIDADIAAGRWGEPGDRSVVRTRFPPEPNGYLHIGHAKSILLNAGLAERYGGAFLLRFDDTNPVKEEQAFVDSIVRDVEWLGAEWEGEVRFASDYFPRFYAYAQELVRKGLAYVDEQPPEDIKAQRGTLTEPGTASPHRDRPAEESLDLLERMKRGEFADGSKVLRARIDMSSPNMNLRDPVMYRILNAPHHRTGDAWHIYPMYDWAHGLEDSIERITHSICTLEFENHRPLYDWFLDAINRDRGPGSEWGEPIRHPQQIEFAKLIPGYTVMSKRNLGKLVADGTVDGWDDPRMPTISALRRRGCTPEAIRAFVEDTGVTKANSLIDFGRLENAVRDHLNKTAPRRMAVLDPLKVVIESWPEGEVDWLDAVNNPEDASAGTRKVPFSRELYIERDDFMMDAPKKFYRLTPGKEVRLRYGYWITCTEAIANDAGEVVELRCTHDPRTRGGDAPPPDEEGNVRKVKGTLHWVSAPHAVSARVRLLDRLFTAEQPGKQTGDPLHDLNADSLREVGDAKLEPAIADESVRAGEPAWPDGIRRYQFERLGYFCVDPAGGSADQDAKPVFNRTVTLKDSWAKVVKKG